MTAPLKYVLRQLLRIAMVCGLALPMLVVAQRNGTEPRDWQERDRWQRPAEVMDALGLRPGSVVADIGAGRGYFTVHLAERVGNAGKVYAVDIDKSILRKLRDEAEKRKLPQIEVVEGTADDPHLPAGGLDAVLIVNAYHEFRQHDAMLQAIRHALRPGGVVGIIEKDADGGEKREAYESRHRLPSRFVRQDLAANGFGGIRDQRGFDPTGEHEGEKWYFLVAEKPQ
jgi:predicted methyltransferase